MPVSGSLKSARAFWRSATVGSLGMQRKYHTEVQSSQRGAILPREGGVGGVGGPGEALGEELVRAQWLDGGLIMMSLGEAGESRGFEDGSGDVDGAGLAKEWSSG